MKFTFLTHAGVSFEKQSKILERSIRLYEPEAEFLKIPIRETDGKSYIKGLPKERFTAVLNLLQNGRDIVILIGADCVFFDSFEQVRLAIDNNPHSSVILTSHINHPCNNVNQFYSTGIAQGDCVIFNNTTETIKILEWLIEQDTDRDDKKHGFFYEQPLLSCLPYLFDDVQIMSDDSVGVAYYNLHERDLTYDDGHFFINGSSLTMFHFSGFQLGFPDQLSRHMPIRVSKGAEAELLKWYVKELRSA